MPAHHQVVILGCPLCHNMIILAAMGKRSHPTLQRLKGKLSVAVLKAVSLLPFSVTYRLAGILGDIVSRMPTSSRAISEINLALCYPNMAESDRQQLARQSLIESLRNSFEFALFWHRSQEALDRVVDVQGFEPVKALIDAKTPVLILAPHLGCWEVLNLWLARHCSLHVMFAPSQFPEVDDLIRQGREHQGSIMYPATARGVAGLVKAIRQGAVSGILPDQVPAKGSGVHAPFFGQPAYTGTLGCKLIRQTGAVGVMAWAERLPKGQGYRLHFSMADADVGHADNLQAATALNRENERLINQCPEQYLWSYKRFRRTPTGINSPYASLKR